MVIKSKKKFLRAIFFILVLTIGLVLLMTGKTLSHQDPKLKNVSVVYGDTLWDIAKDEQESNSYYYGNDIRDIIENIKSVNNLKNSNLQAGQILEIPTY